MKTIISIKNAANKGKTKTIRKFTELICKKYPEHEVVSGDKSTINNNSGDFHLVLKINGKILGIESRGDPNTKLKERLSNLFNYYNCDLVICSTRTRGKTVKAVKGFKNDDTDIIWASTYQTNNASLQDKVNALRAEEILNLLEILNRI